MPFVASQSCWSPWAKKACLPPEGYIALAAAREEALRPRFDPIALVRTQTDASVQAENGDEQLAAGGGQPCRSSSARWLEVHAG